MVSGVDDDHAHPAAQGGGHALGGRQTYKTLKLIVVYFELDSFVPIQASVLDT
jgi:hypothetical protein